MKQEEVEDCCRLIEKVGFHSSNYKRKYGTSSPGSPKGVGDMCFSSSDDDSWLLTSSTTASVSSSPQPLPKKIKTK